MKIDIKFKEIQKDAKFIDVTSKGVREVLRDKRGFVLLLGLPVLLVILFAFTFGSGTFLAGGSLPHDVVVINEDAGVQLTLNNTTKNVNYGSNLAGVLRNATLENSSTNLFTLSNMSLKNAETRLESKSIDALIVIEKNYSRAVVAMVNDSTRTAMSSTVGQQSIANASSIAAANATRSSVSTPGANVNSTKAENITSTLFIQGDTSDVDFAASQILITKIFDQYNNEVLANATGSNPTFLFTKIVPIEGTESFTLFDTMVPGLIVFALLLQVGLVASNLVKEEETGLLDRLKLSKIRAFDLLFGTFITWTMVTVGQIIILLAIAIVIGYTHQGDFSALGLATFIGVIAGMASISLALIIASFVKSERQAIGLSAMLAVPLGFMSGAFIPLPPQELGTFGARTYQIYDLLPWTHAVSALRSVLTYGTGLNASVTFEMFWLIILTIMLFSVGVAIYALVKLRTKH